MAAVLAAIAIAIGKATHTVAIGAVVVAAILAAEAHLGHGKN